MIHISIGGVDKVIDDLGRMDGMDWAETPMKKATMLLQGRMKKYPAARVGSDYVRTGTLGRKWTVKPFKKTAKSITGIVGNNTGYAPWVQSKLFQARTHRGRWLTDAMAVQQEATRIAGFFSDAIDTALAGK
jgi:hypothetical protein